MSVKICDKWNEYLDRFPKAMVDIYYTEGYVKLYENDKDSAQCIIYENGELCALMPFLRRQINEFYDFETPYGYGGPIFNFDSEELIDKALTEMRNCFINENYLCGFIRFHPLIRNAELCKNVIPTIDDRKTTVIDVSGDENKIWNTQLSSKCRNMVRKARKNGLDFKAEYDFESIKRFRELYTETMNRLGADEFYYFGDEYYLNYMKNLDGKSFLGTVSKDGEIISAALFMFFDKWGHYHLAGSSSKYPSLGINNFMLWNASLEMNRNNVERFHLGGGTCGDEQDSLYRFKKSFSRDYEKFFIGKWIFRREEYDNICKSWEEKNRELESVYRHYLLKYRY